MNEIEVYIDLDGVTHRVGMLRVQARSGRTSAIFEYHASWLALPQRFSLEPALLVGEGVFAPDRGREMFVSMAIPPRTPGGGA